MCNNSHVQASRDAFALALCDLALAVHNDTLASAIKV
jgi:hypothetical protein